MRVESLASATLRLNKVPCDCGPGCANNLVHMLPEGSVLHVYAPGYYQPFVGLPDPPRYPQ